MPSPNFDHCILSNSFIYFLIGWRKCSWVFNQTLLLVFGWTRWFCLGICGLEDEKAVRISGMNLNWWHNMVVVCRHISGELPSKPRCCFSASSFLLGRVCGMRAPYGNGCIFALGGWNQKCVGDGSRNWSLTRSLEAWSICLTPTSSLWRHGSKTHRFLRIVIQNLKSVVFFLKVKLYFIFGIYFCVCICVHVHICIFHTPHSMICLVSLFFSWLITNVPILCTFNNILQLCQKLMPCLLMHNFEKSFHFE